MSVTRIFSQIDVRTIMFSSLICCDSEGLRLRVAVWRNYEVGMTTYYGSWYESYQIYYYYYCRSELP